MRVLLSGLMFFWIVFCNAQTFSPDEFIWKLNVEKSSGTCFFIHKDGYLLTAAHNFWDQKSDGGLIANWSNTIFQIINKNGDKLGVKIVDIKCDSFYKNYKVCNNSSGVDVALLEVIDKEELKKYDLTVPEILMRDSERLPLNDTRLYGFDPKDPILKLVNIAQITEVSQNTVGMSDFVLTKTKQWYTNEILYERVKAGFSGAPILNYSNKEYEIIGLLTSRYSSGKGFAEMSKNFYQVFEKVNLSKNHRINSVLKKVKNGNVARSDINPLSRLEVFYLINYLRNNQGKIDSRNICYSFFKIKHTKLINPLYLESILLDFLNNKVINSACRNEYLRKAEMGDFIFKNQAEITDAETLKWGYQLYEEAELEEFNFFSSRRKLSFYDSFANAANVLGDKTQDKKYYTTSIEKSLMAGFLASEMDRKQYRYAENTANVLHKIGDLKNSLYFFEKAYVERVSSNSNPDKLLEDIIYLKGRIDNKIYEESDVFEITAKVRKLDRDAWSEKIKEIH